MEAPEISKDTIFAIVVNGQGEGFIASYLAQGCQDLRRNALYTWMSDSIKENRMDHIDFLEIMVSVVLKLKDDNLI